jgi:hypothetical protein
MLSRSVSVRFNHSMLYSLSYWQHRYRNYIQPKERVSAPVTNHISHAVWRKWTSIPVVTNNSVALVRERTIPTERHAACLQSYCQLLRIQWCRGVCAEDPYGRNLDFLGWSRYFFFQVGPQLYSRDWVNPVSGPLLLVAPGIEPRDQELRPLGHRGSPSILVHF